MIQNMDDLWASYTIEEQDETSKRIARIMVEPLKGNIKPNEKQTLKVTIKTEILGNIRIPLFIKVEGHDKPHRLTILAQSVGPIVTVDPRDLLDFSDVTVLHDEVRKLTIYNDSEIKAEYTTFTRSKNSIWRIEPRHGELQPEEHKTIDVTCTADECQKFSDSLHFVICDGMDFEIQLRARGIGSTLFCKTNYSLVDFGTNYTNTNKVIEFFFENRGRKSQKITWTREFKAGSRKKKEIEPSVVSPTKKPGDVSLISMTLLL